MKARLSSPFPKLTANSPRTVARTGTGFPQQQVELGLTLLPCSESSSRVSLGNVADWRVEHSEKTKSQVQAVLVLGLRSDQKKVTSPSPYY